MSGGKETGLEGRMGPRRRILERKGRSGGIERRKRKVVCGRAES
jgi:hypothetical protein